MFTAETRTQHRTPPNLQHGAPLPLRRLSSTTPGPLLISPPTLTVKMTLLSSYGRKEPLRWGAASPHPLAWVAIEPSWNLAKAVSKFKRGVGE